MSPGDKLGTLVWTGVGYTRAFDVSLQTYKGEPVITFYNGTLLDGFGHGSYYILDQTYTEIKHFSPVGYEDFGDLHEFRITDDDTALVTLYIVKQADLTSVNGTSDGYFYEGSFQEINLETGELIFMWNATDHVALNETYNTLGDAGDETTPFDFFHINSVTKDSDGNYLISSRTMWTVYKINGTTGDIIWRLHGRQSDFDVDDDADFHWQHNARWVDSTHISIFDNQGDDDDTYSRGMLLAVDEDAMTVTLEQEFHNGDSTYSRYEGNLQCLDCGDLSSTNWFLGYGNQPYFAEFAADGTVVMDVQFAVDNAVNSYRAYKYPLTSWVGRPATNPNVSWDASGEGVYLSWNGATEVDTWEVYTADGTNSSADWTKVASATRTGFETLVDVSGSDMSTYVRGKALNSTGGVLGLTDATDGASFYQLDDESNTTSTATTTAGSAMATATGGTQDDSSGAALLLPGLKVTSAVVAMIAVFLSA
ncbi:ASST-domain-containing protein [Truncatella angustata]|uniref:ASST-domain-containing protein n=1 Tax=Truncatella angustata TaxID=152316 RepID=A0A9P8UJ43_9PEZI|nr:ASST-domain-containing protein [Truncatella angustata]KAH6653054.1 ASST-domain-containing protein [Truncatella angustata]